MPFRAFSARVSSSTPLAMRFSVSHANLADVFRRRGETAFAKDALGKGKEIMWRMTALSPDNATWKQDLAWFEGQIAALEK